MEKAMEHFKTDRHSSLICSFPVRKSTGGWSGSETAWRGSEGRQTLEELYAQREFPLYEKYADVILSAKEKESARSYPDLSAHFAL